MDNEETITVRQSRAVIGRYTVFIEKGNRRAALQTMLHRHEAIELAKDRGTVMRLPVMLYLDRPDFNNNGIIT